MMQISQLLGTGNLCVRFSSENEPEKDLIVVHVQMTPDAAIELAHQLFREAQDLKRELAKC